MSSAIIPEAQFNALPYVSVAQYLAEAGDVEIWRGELLRFFSPTATGINAWPGNVGDPFVGGWMAYSNQMDCRGCAHYTFMLCTKMRERQHDLPMSIVVYARAWVPGELGALQPPLVKLLTNAWSQVGSLVMNTSDPGHVDPLLPPGDPAWPIWYKSAACSWDVGDIAPGGTIQAGLTGQMAIRLAAPAGVGALLSGFNALLYGSLLAQT